MPDDAYAVNPTSADITVSDGTSQTVPAFSMKKVDVTTFGTWLTAGCGLVPLTTAYAERRRMANALRHGPALDDGTVTAATLSTALTGTNNDLDWTAKLHTSTKYGPIPYGAAGNRITIAYTVPTDDNAAHALALSMTVSENGSGQKTFAIVCQLQVNTDGSTIMTTGDLLKTAIEADADISQVVTVADKAANDGSGLLVAMAATALSGGAGALYERVEG